MKRDSTAVMARRRRGKTQDDLNRAIDAGVVVAGGGRRW